MTTETATADRIRDLRAGQSITIDGETYTVGIVSYRVAVDGQLQSAMCALMDGVLVRFADLIKEEWTTS